MVTPEKPNRPWWRKKRWRAAGVLSLALSYAAGVGPLVYVDARGWLPQWISAPLLLPSHLAAAVPVLGDVVSGYARLWIVRAHKDEGYEVEVDANGNITAHRTTISIDADADVDTAMRKFDQSRRYTDPAISN